jgi:hypothetical protein
LLLLVAVRSSPVQKGNRAIGSLQDARQYLVAQTGQNVRVLEQQPVKCCFLGYTELSKDEKLALIREHHQGAIDWTKNISNEEMLPMIDEMIQFSKHLQEECAKYGIKYFDVSHDFEGVRNEAFEYLFSEE